MNITYFLTGSYKDVDNDFELAINTLTGTAEAESANGCEVILTDLSSEKKLMWQTAQSTFLLCLNELDEFVIENLIVFYSKILTSSERDKDVDKELEGFILNRLEY